VNLINRLFSNYILNFRYALVYNRRGETPILND